MRDTQFSMECKHRISMMLFRLSMGIGRKDQVQWARQLLQVGLEIIELELLVELEIKIVLIQIRLICLILSIREKLLLEVKIINNSK